MQTGIPPHVHVRLHRLLNRTFGALVWADGELTCLRVLLVVDERLGEPILARAGWSGVPGGMGVVRREWLLLV